MKVYVKKGEYQSPIPAIIIAIILLSFSIGVFISLLSYDNFMEGLSKISLGIVFAIIFFCVGIYVLGASLFACFKKPKKYTATLIYKESDQYKGQNITYMIFSVVKKKNRADDLIPDEYGCFTYEDNNLIVDKQYDVYIKEFNWKIQRIENPSDTSVIKMTSTTVKPVFVIIEIVIIANILLGIFGVLYFKMYVEIIPIVIFTLGIPYSIHYFKKYEKDNIINDVDDNKDILKKYSILSGTKVVSKNIIIKNLAIYLLIFTFLCMLVAFIINQFSFNNIFDLMLPLLWPIVLILFLMIHYINYDNRLIKKYKLNYMTLENINKVTSFKIFRPTTNRTFEKYFIVDFDSKNLILNVQRTGFIGNKYMIYTKDNIVVAEIRRKILSLGVHYIVRPINIQPYSVRLKLQRQHNYEIVGLPYYNIEGNVNGTQNMLLYNNNVIGSITTKQNKKNWYVLGDTEIELNNTENNINIILIALCVTMGNYESISKRINR